MKPKTSFPKSQLNADLYHKDNDKSYIDLDFSCNNPDALLLRPG